MAQHQARKRFGQNFLTDESVVDSIVRAVAPVSGDRVIEIGPGLSALTRPLLDRLPRQVSGGELQRIALARVLLMKPTLIFADEPTSRLDPLTQQEVISLLVEEARAAGCAVLLVTHDTDIVRCVADRQIVLPGRAGGEQMPG